MFSPLNLNSGFSFKNILTVIIFNILVCNAFANPADLKKESIVQKFYIMNNQPLAWFDSGKDSRRATEWLNELELGEQYGILSNKEEIAMMRIALSDRKKLDPLVKEERDKKLTSMILSFIKELKEGNVHFDYDEINVPKDSANIYRLMDSKSEGKISKLVADMDCKDQEYLVLKNFLNDSLKYDRYFKYKTVVLAMNYRRYLSVNQKSEYILINIPTAEATYFRNDIATIKMRTIPGKKSKPTPTISSYITSIVTFPSWNVPFDIAVKEMLPKIKKNENYLEQNNFEVVDAKGNEVDDADLDWKSYNEKHFPYFLRQSAGSENSLGVIKFNLQGPFSIFLHATSWQGAFLKDNRFLSHGCIRLEKPFELAEALLRKKLDIAELKKGKKDSETSTIMLPEKIQTFIIYVPVFVADNKVTFIKDVYALIK